jgi:uncharacterized coiled-coil DUF342 family protein
MASNIQLLRKRRDQMEAKVDAYATKVQFYANKLRSSRIKLRTYNRKIEKALEEQKHIPKDPTRVVEV